MKLTEMIHQTVVAFKPEKHPFYALIALAMMLLAIVALVYFGGSGASGAVSGIIRASLHAPKIG
jgi:hypothetical protein